MKLETSWTGVAVVVAVLAAALGALALGHETLAVALGTGALGMLAPSPVRRAQGGGPS